MRILSCGKPNKAYVQLIALDHGDSSHPEKWELKMALGDSHMKFINYFLNTAIVAIVPYWIMYCTLSSMDIFQL